jgi:hypothetical protein
MNRKVVRLTEQQQETPPMNPKELFIVTTLASSACLLTACGDYAEVTVLRPADVQIVEDIRTLVVIDRAAPRNFGEELLSGVEGLGSGEGILADREARASAIQEVINVLTESPRFEVIHSSVDTHEYGTSIWDSPMDPWDVQSLCSVYLCDGVISLDAFDSDTDVFELVEALDAESEEEAAVNVAEYILRRETKTVATWRFYDGFNGEIIDSLREHRVGNIFDADGETWEQAVAGLPDGRSVVKGLATQSGGDYVSRIAPVFEDVLRTLYSKGGASVEAGIEAFRMGEMDRAAEIWAEGTLVAESEDRGRCYYNLAVALEVSGDIYAAYDAAVEAHRILRAGRTQSYMHELSTLR